MIPVYKSLERHYRLLKNADDILFLLVRIASSANVLARNRILRPEHIVPADELSSGMFRTTFEPTTYLRVVRQGKKDTPGVSIKLINVHGL
jgi:hypothetical protein